MVDRKYLWRILCCGAAVIYANNLRALYPIGETAVNMYHPL